MASVVMTSGCGAEPGTEHRQSNHFTRGRARITRSGGAPSGSSGATEAVGASPARNDRSPVRFSAAWAFGARRLVVRHVKPGRSDDAVRLGGVGLADGPRELLQVVVVGDV